MSDFVANLEASGYFKKSIEIVSSTTEALAQPPGELVKFTIKAQFQPPGRRWLGRVPRSRGRSGGGREISRGGQSDKAAGNSPDTAG